MTYNELIAIDKPTVFIVYFGFFLIVAIATMLRGEREFIRKEKEKTAKRDKWVQQWRKEGLL
jgi:uncharacterized membrane protein YfcA